MTVSTTNFLHTNVIADCSVGSNTDLDVVMLKLIHRPITEIGSSDDSQLV
ncbi:MAG: hypothetical protein ACI9SP_003163 [Arenicella sp.]|jgi:hypothetical protein